MRSSLIDSQRLPHEPDQPLAAQPSDLFAQLPTSRQASFSTRPRFFHIASPQEGWLALILLAVALYSVVVVMVGANWVHYSAWLYICPVVGLLVGFLVAKTSLLSQAFLHLLSCLIGHVLAISVTSSLAFHVPWIVVIEGLQAAFTGQMAQETPLVSEIVFFFYLAFLSFFLGYFGSWLIYRARLPWLVALVYSSIMLVNLNYVKSDFNYLLIFMLGALVLLIARVQLAARLSQWTSEGLYTDRTWLRKITRRCMQVACLIMVLSLPLSWLLPMQQQPDSGKIFWDTMNMTWNSALSGNLSWDTLRSLASFSPRSTNYFGNQLAIANAIHLPDGEVLTYRSSDQKSHYLESVTFDHFSSNTWTISARPQLEDTIGPNVQLATDSAREPDHTTITQVTLTQTINGAKNYLFAPAQPTAFNIPTQIFSNGAPDVHTTAAWAATNALTAKSSYQVVSAIARQENYADVPLPAQDANFWQNDRYNYWLNVSYLQTPQDLSPAVKKTVQEWTDGSTTAYGALKNIEAHFNDSHVFKYSLENAPIPANADVVDWLLQTHTGYCTYYASAMAVMGRILHIPTRMVTGFSAGKYDSNRNVWSVLGSDAHSWVQAYFPGYGWVDFEPTPGFSTASVGNGKAQIPPPIVPTRPAVKATPTLSVQPTRTVQNSASKPVVAKQTDDATYWLPILYFAVSLLLLSLAFLLVSLFVRRWRLLYSSSPIVSGLYWRACRVASWSGLGPKSWQTPYEYTQMLSRQMPEKEEPLWRLTELFVRERWGSPHHVPHEQEAASVEHSWPSLRSVLFRLLLHKKVK